MEKVENTSAMFFSAAAFNQPIGSWDMRNVLDLTNMIYGAISFNQDIATWNININAVGVVRINNINNKNECGNGFELYLKISETMMILISNVPPPRIHCPPKVIPITRPGNERTKAFGYARLVNNAFGTTSRGYRSKKQIVKLNTDVYGSAAGAPGGTRSPPRNF